MQRHELEHIIRAAAAITQEYDIVVVGSQSILGQFPDAPSELLQSREADVYPLHYSEKKSDLIDGTIGEGSPFEEIYGYYAQGVGPETALLPQGWRDRLVKVQSQNTDLKIGWCLEPHDLAASKLAAAREKDHEFVAALLRHGLVEKAEVEKRIQTMPVTQADKHRMTAMLTRLARETGNRIEAPGAQAKTPPES